MFIAFGIETFSKASSPIFRKEFLFKKNVSKKCLVVNSVSVPIEVAAVVISELGVVLFENLSAEIDDFVFRAFAVVVAAVLPLSSAGGMHVRGVVLLVAGPLGRAAKFLFRGVRVGDAFDLRKGVLASSVLVQLDRVDPHLSSWVVPLVPWIRAVEEVPTDGDVQDEVKFLIEGLSWFLVEWSLHDSIDVDSVDESTVELHLDVGWCPFQRVGVVGIGDVFWLVLGTAAFVSVVVAAGDRTVMDSGLDIMGVLEIF